MSEIKTDKYFIADFLDWVAQECTIKESGDPWGAGVGKKWFYYKGEQMVEWQLLNKYIEINGE